MKSNSQGNNHSPTLKFNLKKNLDTHWITITTWTGPISGGLVDLMGTLVHVVTETPTGAL